MFTFCYFILAAMTYRIVVVGEGKHFGLSTACLYVNLGGDFGETGLTEMARGEYQTEITVSGNVMKTISPITSSHTPGTMFILV